MTKDINPSKEYRLTVDHLIADETRQHPLACHHFPIEDYAALCDTAKQEMAAGYLVTITIVDCNENCVDYDDRCTGGTGGTVTGH